MWITFRTYYYYSKVVAHFLITCTCSGTHSTLCFSSNTMSETLSVVSLLWFVDELLDEALNG